MKYDEFLTTKSFLDVESGFVVSREEIHKGLFDFQAAVTVWALRRGRAAVFMDTGLGKTRLQVEWARHVEAKTKRPVLILAPLCVSPQTVKEAALIDVKVDFVREQPTAERGIFITNYEMLHHFDLSQFSGLVLDESSIIKHHTSKTRNKIIVSSRGVPYRLSCTATPSPNDHMELGNQAEFLGVMSQREMLSMFFTHDSGETSKWRLKGHGKKRFWEWLSTWAVCMRKPSDLGFDDSKYNLPPLELHTHIVQTAKTFEGELFVKPAQTMSERLQARRETVQERAEECAKFVNASKDQFIVWCNLNSESDLLKKLIPDAVEIRGSQTIEQKEERIEAFTSGKARVVVSKSSITGFGLNWQFCQNMAFVGLNDSYEEMYQAIRRCYRFGQKKTVNVHIISADIEGAVLENIKRKELQAAEMSQAMVEHMREFSERKIKSLSQEKTEYQPQIKFQLPAFWGAQHERRIATRTVQ